MALNTLQRIGFSMSGELPQMLEAEQKEATRTALMAKAKDPAFQKLPVDQQITEIMGLTGDPSAYQNYMIQKSDPLRAIQLRGAEADLLSKQNEANALQAERDMWSDDGAMPPPAAMPESKSPLGSYGIPAISTDQLSGPYMPGASTPAGPPRPGSMGQIPQSPLGSYGPPKPQPAPQAKAGPAQADNLAPLRKIVARARRMAAQNPARYGDNAIALEAKLAEAEMSGPSAPATTGLPEGYMWQNNKAVRIAGLPAGGNGMTPYQNESLAVAKEERDLRRDERHDKRLDDQVEGYSKKADAFASYANALKALDTEIAKYEGGNIPGVGSGGLTPGWALNEDGRTLRQGAISVGNQLLQLRSGAAISPSEASRLANEIGLSISDDGSISVSSFKTDNQLRTGMKNIKADLRARIKNAGTQMSPEAIQIYKERGGSIPPDLFDGETSGGGLDAAKQKRLQELRAKRDKGLL